MKRSARIGLSLLACAVLAGCRTTEEVLHDYEVNLLTGRYSASLPELNELAEKRDGSEQLWRLMAGSAGYLANNREMARRHFDAAENVFVQNDQTSVFAQSVNGTWAMMTNDRAFSYDGGGLDRIFTCLYKAFDCIGAGDKANARVEFNRALQYQGNWLFDRRRDIDAAQRRLEKDAAAYQREQGVAVQGGSAQQAASVLADPTFAGQIRQNCNFDPATSGDLSRLGAADYTNPYALHAIGVFRWINRDSNRNELRDAANFAPGNPTVVRDAAEQQQGVVPRDQVWIWAEDGLCPSREEWKVDLPLMFVPGCGRYLPYVGMAFPVLRERGQGAANWTVQAGGVDVPMAELANVDRLAKTEYDVYMRGALTRQITRTIVLAGVQIALGVAADNTQDRNHHLALKLSQLGVAAWAKMSTAADLRCWTALPKTVKAVRIARPADGMVKVVADNETVPIQIPAGGNTMVFIRKPAPGAPCVVKTATFAAH